MKRNLKLFLPVFFALLFPGGVVAQDHLPELVRRVKPSAVAIETFNAKGERLARGSGFFVASDRIVTNRHVLENAYKADIHLANGDIYRVKGVLAVDGEGDIALLQVDIPPNIAPPLPILRTSPQEGESIVVIGNPLGLEGSVTNGIVSAVRDIPNFGRIIQITAPVSPGSSGSPVVNMYGQVVGIATLQVAEGQSLNFAVPSERIAQLKAGPLSTLGELVAGTLISKRATAERSYMQGLGFLSRDDWPRALSYFERAVEADPAYAEAWYQIGFCNGMLGRHAEALKALSQTARLRPEWPETYLSMGAAYYGLGQYKEAVEAYRRALRLEPYNADAEYALGLAYSRLEKVQDEIQAYRRAIGLNPSHAAAYERLGMAFFRQKRFEEALATWEQFRALRPADEKVFNYIGETYIELKRYQESIEALRQAISINPEFGQARYNLGRAYLQLGDRESAVAQYNILRTYESDWADRLYNAIYP